MDEVWVLFIVFYSLRSIIAHNLKSIDFTMVLAGVLFVLTGIFTNLVVIGATSNKRQKGFCDD